jgi:lysyl-tRNA synthetase class 1
MAVPAEIETVIQALDQGGPISTHDVENALTKARAGLGDISEEAHNNTWGEIVAWSLMIEVWSADPWRCYFGPVGQGRNKDGSAAYIPDVTALNGTILDGWIARVGTLHHPVLKARYADLCWELARRIDGRKPSFHHALAAINSYLVSVETGLTADFYHQMAHVLRAFDLALSIKNKELIVSTRNALLGLHDRGVAGEGLWWKSFDRLIGERNAELTDDDRARLVQSLEGLAEKYANKDDP